jgi:hypothetical protein
MAQPRIAQRALLDQLAGADTHTLRLVLEHSTRSTSYAASPSVSGW